MKQLLLISVLTLLPLNVSAQIQRKIMEQTLGESTKTEVFNALESKGAFRQKLSGEDCIIIREVRFGGCSWGMVIFKFYDNKLFSVMFMDLEENPNPKDVAEKWEKLTTSLSSKYEKYLTDDGENCKTYTDKISMILITNHNNNIILGYSDVELGHKQIEDEENEL